MTLGLSDGTNHAKTFYPIDTMSVNAGSKNVDAAIALLKFITSAETHSNFRENVHASQVQLHTTEAAPEYPTQWVADNMAVLNDYAMVMPVAKGVPAMQAALFTNYQLLIMGELTPEECVAAMQDACATALSE